LSFFALAALRIAVKKSPIKSLRDMRAPYQLDFTTPGSIPVLANSRKQIRQMENFRI